MSLPTAPLGTTGMSITRVGLGAWAIGGGEWSFAWGAQDDDDSIRTIRYAIERGINWIDTAAIYGLGHSEAVVGAALDGLSEGDRPFVFTKGGLIPDPGDPMKRSSRVGSPASIRRELEDSLRRLRVERIDLYQMHWPAEDGTALDEYWETFADLKRSGKVRAIGLSNHGVPQLDAAEAIAHVDTVQPQFSAIHTANLDSGVLDWCADHETGVIVYSPMGSGLLTGAMTAERVAALPNDDWRRTSPEFTDRLDENLARGSAIAEVAQRHSIPQSAAAAAWPLGFRGVTGAIVGARTPEQIDGWIDAASTQLTAEDYATIGSAIPAALAR